MTVTTSPVWSADESPQADNTGRRVDEELTSLLLANGRTGAVAVILGAGLMAPVLAQPPIRFLYLGWLSYMGVAAVVRMMAARRYHRSPAGDRDWKKWRLNYGALCVSIGIGWGAAPLLFWNSLAPVGHSFLLVVLIGVTAAAIP